MCRQGRAADLPPGKNEACAHRCRNGRFIGYGDGISRLAVRGINRQLRARVKGTDRLPVPGNDRELFGRGNVVLFPLRRQGRAADGPPVEGVAGTFRRGDGYRIGNGHGVSRLAVRGIDRQPRARVKIADELSVGGSHSILFRGF